jgi:hypothetical protein
MAGLLDDVVLAEHRDGSTDPGADHHGQPDRAS